MEFGKELIKKAIDHTREAVFADCSLIEITGDRYAVIQGAGGILEYTENFIKIKLKTQSVIFWGENLIIQSLSQDCMEINGKMTRIEYQ